METKEEVILRCQTETAEIRQEFENNDEQERENWENDVLQNVRVETAQIRQEIENNDEQESRNGRMSRILLMSEFTSEDSNKCCGSSSQFQQCNHYTCQITDYQEDQYQYPLHEDNEERPYHRVIRSLRKLLNDIVDFTRLHYPTLRETSYPRLHIAIYSPYNYRRISEMENLGQLDGLREQNNGDLAPSSSSSVTTSFLGSPELNSSNMLEDYHQRYKKQDEARSLSRRFKQDTREVYAEFSALSNAEEELPK
ncbi:unnamed protein product [Porites evermanni]|uniref:Uncharacterized protein n=1 Tax=Porites evermanni TaxID=104178 RepID=A0ABN8MU92_9CNID|nr:unnamed protein product [Porites evermanni]